MVDPRSGARAVIRDTRSAAGRFCWSVLAPDQMDPMSDGRTGGPTIAHEPNARARAAGMANPLPAVPALPHIERTFTSAPQISLVVQPSSGELPSQSAD